MTDLSITMAANLKQLSRNGYQDTGHTSSPPVQHCSSPRPVCSRWQSESRNEPVGRSKAIPSFLSRLSSILSLKVECFRRSPVGTLTCRSLVYGEADIYPDQSDLFIVTSALSGLAVCGDFQPELSCMSNRFTRTELDMLPDLSSSFIFLCNNIVFRVSFFPGLDILKSQGRYCRKRSDTQGGISWVSCFLWW